MIDKLSLVELNCRAICGVLLSAVMVLGFQTAWAEDEIITIEGAKIRGNQELPTILYLVPWQNPEIQGIEAPERNFAVQRGLEPLERTEFQRLIGYHEQFMKSPKLDVKR